MYILAQWLPSLTRPWAEGGINILSPNSAPLISNMKQSLFRACPLIHLVPECEAPTVQCLPMPPLQYATRPHTENMKHSRTNRIPIQGQKSLPSEFAQVIQTLKGGWARNVLMWFFFILNLYFSQECNPLSAIPARAGFRSEEGMDSQELKHQLLLNLPHKSNQRWFFYLVHTS